jgi:hypothetical protein
MGRPKGLPKTGGRVKGSGNLLTSSVRDSLVATYHAIGSDEGFAKWATTERSEFYKLWAKMLPADINNNNLGSVTFTWQGSNDPPQQ